MPAFAQACFSTRPKLAALSFEKVFLCAVGLVIIGEKIEQLRAQRYHTVFLAFGPADMQQVPDAMNVSQFQVEQFASSQSAGVDQAQHGPVLPIDGGFEYAFYLLLAQHIRQHLRPPRTVNQFGIYGALIQQFCCELDRIHHLILK